MGQTLADRVLIAKSSDGEMNDLLREYRPFILSAVLTNSPKAEEDYVQAGMLAFAQAVRTFEPGKGSFLSFAKLLISRRVIDCIRQDTAHPELPLLDQEDEESRSYYCEVIMDEANKMNKMVKQLLTLTALEFGRDMPVIEPFDGAELIRDLVNSSSILLQQNEAQVEVSVPEHLEVLGDEFKIEEVVTNYLTNAIHHLDGERLIRIRAEVRKETGQALSLIHI